MVSVNSFEITLISFNINELLFIKNLPVLLEISLNIFVNFLILSVFPIEKNILPDILSWYEISIIVSLLKVLNIKRFLLFNEL